MYIWFRMMLQTIWKNTVWNSVQTGFDTVLTLNNREEDAACCEWSKNMNRIAQKTEEFIRERPFLSHMMSTGWNLTFAIINGIISIVYRSYWYLTLFAIYLLFGLMRLSTLRLPKSKRRTAADLLWHNGLAMFGLAIIECGLMILTIVEHRNPLKGKMIAVITAAYTLVFLVLSIRNTIKAHRQKSAVMISLRNISCASAVVSVLSLERSMLGTFGTGSVRFTLSMEAWSGGIAFLILIVMGTGMLILSRKEKQHTVNNNEIGE